MAFRILVRSDNDKRKGQDAAMRIRGNGAIAFNKNAGAMLGLSDGDSVVFAEEAGKFYVMKLAHEDGFKVRAHGRNGGFTCNSKSIVDNIASAYDVEFGSRIKSVAFKLGATKATYNGAPVFEVKNKSLRITELPLLSKNNK